MPKTQLSKLSETKSELVLDEVYSFINLHRMYLSRSVIGRSVFDGCDMRGVCISESVLFDSAFSKVKMQNIEFSNSVLSGIKVKNSGLSGAIIRSCVVRNCDIVNCDLFHVDMSYSDLRDSRIAGERMESMILNGCIYNSGTEWPNDFDTYGKNMIFVE